MQSCDLMALNGGWGWVGLWVWQLICVILDLKSVGMKTGRDLDTYDGFKKAWLVGVAARRSFLGTY